MFIIFFRKKTKIEVDFLNIYIYGKQQASMWLWLTVFEEKETKKTLHNKYFLFYFMINE